ncbi:hypothetical protein [Adhaeribacter pallidiroseus]|uniref:Uncharacterized protein n=1 Tax=Adhaeribacter pallidiroseus TaxID=2072847 RepID=A0A369QUR4_9BACT|nr:hypothetical protein [Adhaeribacter pallidiroseus]RDC66529.1 hypothetical protein AHMF7616_05160 [Adhaeribacter pallidiroseus]
MESQSLIGVTMNFDKRQSEIGFPENAENPLTRTLRITNEQGVVESRLM